MQKIATSITTDYIKLESLLKLAGLAGTGGEAKWIIQQGDAAVNRVRCTQRGRKLRVGDVVALPGVEITVV